MASISSVGSAIPVAAGGGGAASAAVAAEPVKEDKKEDEEESEDVSITNSFRILIKLVLFF